MSVTFSAKYTKNEATFASGVAAYADKNSLYSPELVQQVEDCYAQMITDGVLLAPVDPVWDQETFTLTINKLVTSVDDYEDAITFDVAACVAASNEAGWVTV